MKVDTVHEIEALGPMTTIMPYDSTEEASQLANKSDDISNSQRACYRDNRKDFINR